MKNNNLISDLDIFHYKIIRANVSKSFRNWAKKFDSEGNLLDIAPQVHEGASPYFKKATIFTLDIDPLSKANYIADICKNNKKIIPENQFKFITCTEVLEHVLNPFSAVDEMYRMLQPKGILFITTPFNFRIHGPLPDCWRFTEYGLRTLLKKFTILSLDKVDDKSRWLMPIHYSIIAQKP